MVAAAGSGSLSAWAYPAWSTYRAYLNAVPMSDSALDPRDQYARSKDWVDDSFCDDFRSWLAMGGICVEDFTSGFDLRKTTPEGGLPLANPIDVQLDVTVAAKASVSAAQPTSCEHAFCGVMLKYLSISPAGVTLESV